MQKGQYIGLLICLVISQWTMGLLLNSVPIKSQSTSVVTAKTQFDENEHSLRVNHTECDLQTDSLELLATRFETAISNLEQATAIVDIDMPQEPERISVEHATHIETALQELLDQAEANARFNLHDRNIISGLIGHLDESQRSTFDARYLELKRQFDSTGAEN